MIELYVNGLLLEGLTDSIALTKAIGKLDELDTRNGEYSNTISVPATKSNLLALAHPNSVNGIQSRITKLSNYQLFESGVLISEGLCIVISVQDDIKILLVSSNTSYSKIIKDIELRSMDVSSLNYSLLPAQVASRRNLTNTMCLPNIWYGDYYDTARPNDVMDFQPSFFIRYLVERLINDAGFTVDYQFENSTIESLYNSTITVQSKKEWNYSLQGYDFYVELTQDANIYNVSTFFGGDRINKKSNDIDIVGCPIVGKGFESIANPLALNVLRITSDRNIGEGLGGYIIIEILTVTTGGMLEILSGNNLDVIGQLNVIVPGIFRIEISPTVTASTGNDYDFIVQIGLPLDITYRIIGGELWSRNPNAKEATQTYSTSLEYVANVQGALPELKAGEFLLDVFNIFGLVTSTNIFTKQVSIASLDLILLNIGNAIDWTSKADLSEPVEILYDYFDKYYQRNILKYKDDEKDPRISLTKYGEGEIIYLNENVGNTGTVYESNFSAIQRGSELVPPMAACESRVYGDLNWKLGYAQLTATNLVTQFGQAAPSQSNEVFFDDLIFSERIPANYKLVKKSLENNICIRILIKLTRLDFQNYNFTIPVFLDITTENNGQIRGHFYVNEIEQYKVGESDSTYVTLVKID